jgi:hypothetical protein
MNNGEIHLSLRRRALLAWGVTALFANVIAVWHRSASMGDIHASRWSSVLPRGAAEVGTAIKSLLGRPYQEAFGYQVARELDDDYQRGASTAEIRRRLAIRVSRDFAEGRTVSIEGWQLSQTEVQLSMLAANLARLGHA